jgi:hypothetical protein
MIRSDPAGIGLRRIFSLYQSPDEVLLILVLHFPPEWTSERLTGSIQVLREKIKRRFSRISYIVIEPE